MNYSCNLCVLRVLVVIFFHRKDAKDAKKNTKIKGFIKPLYKSRHYHFATQEL